MRFKLSMEDNVAGIHSEASLISRLFVPAGKHESCIRLHMDVTVESRGANCLPRPHPLQYAPFCLSTCVPTPGVLATLALGLFLVCPSTEHHCCRRPRPEAESPPGEVAHVRAVVREGTCFLSGSDCGRVHALMVSERWAGPSGRTCSLAFVPCACITGRSANRPGLEIAVQCAHPSEFGMVFSAQR